MTFIESVECLPRQYFTSVGLHGPVTATLRGRKLHLGDKPCDRSHSTVVSPDDSLPVAFPQQFRGRVLLGRPSIGFKTIKSGGIVTAMYWVCFFLGVSMLSLCALACLRIKAGIGAFLKRQYKTVAAIAGPAASCIRLWARRTRGRGRSQPEAAGFEEREFREFCRLERTCPSVDRIAVLRRRPVVRPGDLCAVEEPAGSSLHARNFRTDL